MGVFSGSAASTTGSDGRSGGGKSRAVAASDAAAAVRGMMRALRHRGPDGEGLSEIAVGGGEGRLMLGHTRLSILDLSAGSRQPMCHAETGSWLAYNGEIYNFRELRAELEALGFEFQTSGDTEVLLLALVEWGAAALPRLEGMFALAFWDGRSEELLLARDAMGMKPLYYFAAPGMFAFASEVKALERAELGSLTVDRAAVDSFLSYGAVVGPRTIWKEIRELEPGRFLRMDSSVEFEEGEYWELASALTEAVAPLRGGTGEGARPHTGSHSHTSSPPHTASWRTDGDACRSTVRGLDFEGTVALVRGRLEAAVRAHLVSDVPVGVFLSGGIDSSLLAVMASRCAESPITFLTVDFPEQEFSELTYAREIARNLPHPHKVVTLSADDLRELLPDALAAMDQPTVDGINTYVICKAGAAAGLKVLLTGVGGDELFGGYTTFKKVPQLLKYGAGMRPVARLLARAGTANPIQWRKIADAGSLNNLSEAYLLQRSIRWRRGDGGSDFAKEMQESVEPLANDFQKIAALELQFYMRNQLLRDADVFSMANSVELRVPFLDVPLVEAALAVDPANHFAGGLGKRITKRILSDLLDEQAAFAGTGGDALRSGSTDKISNRRKMGFTFPWRTWLRDALRETIARTLRDEQLYGPLGLDPACGRELLDGLDRDDRLQSWSEVWSLFVLLNWQARNEVACAVA